MQTDRCLSEDCRWPEGCTVSPEPNAYPKIPLDGLPINLLLSPPFLPKLLTPFLNTNFWNRPLASSLSTPFLGLLSASSDHARLFDATRKQGYSHSSPPRPPLLASWRNRKDQARL
ncbi:hypothetical protein PMIN03_006873 [Paraphaeosphaeria minitans]